MGGVPMAGPIRREYCHQPALLTGQSDSPQPRSYQGPTGRAIAGPRGLAMSPFHPGCVAT